VAADAGGGSGTRACVRPLERNRRRWGTGRTVPGDALGSKVVKGPTCPAEGVPLRRFQTSTRRPFPTRRAVDDGGSSLTRTGRSRIVAESSQACRRKGLRPSGDVEVGRRRRRQPVRAPRRPDTAPTPARSRRQEGGEGSGARAAPGASSEAHAVRRVRRSAQRRHARAQMKGCLDAATGTSFGRGASSRDKRWRSRRGVSFVTSLTTSPSSWWTAPDGKKRPVRTPWDFLGLGHAWSICPAEVSSTRRCKAIHDASHC